MAKVKRQKHLPLAVACASVLLPFLTFFILYFGKIYPGVYVAGINLSGRSPEEAIKILSKISPPKQINLTSGSQTFEIPTESFGLSYDYSKTADAAYKFARTGSPFFDLSEIFKAFLGKKQVGLRENLDETKLANSIFTIAGQVGLDPVYPSAKLINGKVVIDGGRKGNDLDANQLRLLIGSVLANATSDPIVIPIVEIDPTLNPFAEADFTKRAQAIAQKNLTLTFEFQQAQYSGQDLLDLINPAGGYQDAELSKLTDKVAQQINRPPQDAKLVFNQNQKRVDTFAPSLEGVSVKRDELSAKITQALDQDDNRVSLVIPVETTKPKIQTADVNNLGISELIGRGTSIFWGSIASRVYNVNLAATRISGTLIAPGETFSFNDAVGDISELTGYQKAYIIENGKTILGDGGGVCQVSTTLFRAVLDAGLPITERTAHAYRVYYYEEDAPPGFDATVFSPTVDFKFKNDTPGYILIQAVSNPRNYSLTFELYGTKDGRVAEVGKPVITETTPPPPDVYQDDPTLPAGTIKQTEHRALGTKLYLVYKVTRNGETIFQKTFYSIYRPWGNVFLRSTGV